MKRTFTFILSLLLAASSFAQYGQTVTVSFKGNAGGIGRGNGNNNRSLEVVIDGRAYSADNSYGNNNNRNGSWKNDNNGIVLNNLSIGQHSIAINGSRNNGNRNGNMGQGNQAHYSSTFIVKQGYDLDIEVKGNGQVAYIERPSSYNNGRRYDGGRGRDGRYDRRDDRDDDWRNNNGGYNNGGNGGYNKGGTGNGGYGGYNNRYPPMSDAAFNDLLQNVRGKWLQSGKVSAVNSAFDNTANYFSTYQARQLLEQISSETNRLALAKISYKNVVDKNNFTQLYDLFSSQSNKDELDRYVRSYRY